MKIIDKIQNAINFVFCTALLLLDHIFFYGHFLKFKYFLSRKMTKLYMYMIG